MSLLPKGANAPIAASSVNAVLSWTAEPGVPDVDASALLLTDSGKVRNDSDFIFFNAPRHASGAVSHTGKQSAAGSTATDSLKIDLTQVETAIDKVIVAASADGGTFGQVNDLQLVLYDVNTGAELVRFADMGATTETAFVVGELYRREGTWKFRAVGQGWNSGLGGLAIDFGITVDESPSPPSTSTPEPSGATTSSVPASFASAYASSAPTRSTTISNGASSVVTLDKGRVSLSKGQRVSLVKSGAPALNEVVMGLGWDPAHSGKSIDLDASVIALDAAGNKLEIVWFMHLKEFGGAIRHSGDNLTGKGDGDDERIQIKLNSLPPKVATLVFTITSFRGQKFTEISRAFCRLVDARNGAELVRFDLSNSEPRTGVLMSALVRTPAGPWEMRAIGTYHDGRTAKRLVDPASATVRSWSSPGTA